ncbi:hypothetical protein SAMN05428945_5722 [Streptomyces sp. 2224.1]|nr:hypothetical protein SAMN05428945_5722 [Streptomyces sp. 2224.1]
MPAWADPHLIRWREEPVAAAVGDERGDLDSSHRKVRARVEHAFARMKTWNIMSDCRLKGDDVHHAMLGITRLHNLTLAG